ncbi:MAG: hypothetical protein K5931_05760, partial [Lachnospiraceae bacterium]|nr:hypothetical protein [Lachnospiraceae bacterium]
KCEEIYGEGITESSRLIIGSKAVPPSDSTEEFLNLIFREDSPVILVLAGHIHLYHKCMLNDKICQIVTGPAYAGEAVRITLK